MVNVSGGCWFARPEYESLKKIFIDTDPGFHHLSIAEDQAMDKDLTGYESYSEFFNSYDTLFTFGLNIGHPSCKMAKTPFFMVSDSPTSCFGFLAGRLTTSAVSFYHCSQLAY